VLPISVLILLESNKQKRKKMKNKMKTIHVTESGQDWRLLEKETNAQVWKITDKGFKRLLNSYKPNMIEDEDILDVVDIGDDEVRTLFQTPTESDNTLDQFMENDKMSLSSNLKGSK
jgi:predicted naringenin-chalcone synthase